MVTEAVKARAIQTCEGVIKITKREMLVQGTYITDSIVNEDLAEEGAICGGHQACLVGSLYLSNGLTYTAIRRAANDDWDGSIPGWFLACRERTLEERPSLKVAYDAFNQAAHETILNNYSEFLETEWNESEGEYVPNDYFTPTEGWGEWFFEKVLEDEPFETVNAEIVSVAERAIEMIESGVVS